MTRRPSAAPSGVCTVTGVAGRSRVASAASSRLMRTRHPAEELRRRRCVAQRHERVLHERVLDDMDRHAAHYTSHASGGS